eukprot:354318-Chlamydomonas_euryale.AAC.21
MSYTFIGSFTSYGHACDDPRANTTFPQGCKSSTLNPKLCFELKSQQARRVCTVPGCYLNAPGSPALPGSAAARSAASQESPFRRLRAEGSCCSRLMPGAGAAGEAAAPTLEAW